MPPATQSQQPQAPEAKLKLFRCKAKKCQAKDKGMFWSKKMWPTCPQCHLDSADPKLGQIVQRLVIVHFDPPTEHEGIGHSHRACDAGIAIQAPDTQRGPNPWHAGSGDPRQVNCPACRQSSAFKQALAASEEEEEMTASDAAWNRIKNLGPLIQT